MLLACASLSVFAACGDDSDTDAGTAGSGGAAGVTGGAGGTTGGAGGAKAGTGGGGGAAPVTCGGTMCTVNPVLKMINSAATACCTSGMKCGQYNTGMKCLEQNAKGTPDTSCPSVMVSVLGMNYTQAGCCTAAGMCGADYTMVGWGCVARPDIGSDMGMGTPLMALKCGASGGDGGPGDAGL